MPHIDREYIKPGKLRYVVREFPIESIHPLAFKSAEAALCADEQGKYWEMHERLFGEQAALGPADLPRHADAVGLNRAAFKECLDSGRKAAKIRKDLADGQAAGITGTPSFFLGVVEGDGVSVRIVRGIRGAQPYASFKSAIDGVLATQK